LKAHILEKKYIQRLEKKLLQCMWCSCICETCSYIGQFTYWHRGFCLPESGYDVII